MKPLFRLNAGVSIGFCGFTVSSTGEAQVDLDFHEYGSWAGVIEDNGDTAALLSDAVPVNDLRACDGLEFDELGYLYVLSEAAAEKGLGLNGSISNPKLDPNENFRLRKLAP
jgi:hypothetical protein